LRSWLNSSRKTGKIRVKGEETRMAVANLKDGFQKTEVMRGALGLKVDRTGTTGKRRTKYHLCTQSKRWREKGSWRTMMGNAKHGFKEDKGGAMESRRWLLNETDCYTKKMRSNSQEDGRKRRPTGAGSWVWIIRSLIYNQPSKGKFHIFKCGGCHV